MGQLRGRGCRSYSVLDAHPRLHAHACRGCKQEAGQGGRRASSGDRTRPRPASAGGSTAMICYPGSPYLPLKVMTNISRSCTRCPLFLHLCTKGMCAVDRWWHSVVPPGRAAVAGGGRVRVEGFEGSGKGCGLLCIPKGGGRGPLVQL